MLLAVTIFLLTYALIVSERIDKAIAALLGASLMAALHVAPYQVLLAKIDMNVILLLIGMMIIVNILSRTGIFQWIAVMLAKKTDGNGVAILTVFVLTTAVLSAFLDNVTTVILMAPITILICQILEVKPEPMLILEAIFSNIGGTATLIGDPPNILIASRTGLQFNEFIQVLGPIVLIIVAVTLAIVAPLYGKSLRASTRARDCIRQAQPEKAIVAPQLLRRALAVFSVVLLALFFGHAIGLEPGVIAIAGAMVMLLVCRMDVHDVLQHVEWGTILFFIGLFKVIGGLEANGVFEVMSHHMITLTGGNFLWTVMAVLWVTAILSGIVDNIPMVIAMIPVIEGIIPTFAASMGYTGQDALIQAHVAQPLFWALALGACLGGNGTLVGASANIIVAQTAKRNRCDISFWAFTRQSFPIMLLSLVCASVYLYLRYFR